MLKKTILFSIVIFLFLIIYQYGFNMIKRDHFVTYKIDNGEVFDIEEKYQKTDYSDSYLIKVSKDDTTFLFEVENEFNKQKNIVEGIETIEQDGYYCIGLNLVGMDKYSFPECVKDNVIYSYSAVKNSLNFDSYVSKIVDSNKDRFSKESTKKEDISITINKDYIDKNETLIVYNYKMFYLQYANFSRTFSFSSIDNYKNEFGALVGNYYLIPVLTSLPTFNTYIKYDVIDGIKKEINLPMAVSKQSYINGVKDGKLYLFDQSNKRQFEINPKTDEVKLIGTIDEEGITYVDGEKQSISVYELEKTNVLFQDKVSDYSSIEYDNIYVSDGFAIYQKNGNFYKVYKDYLDNPVLLFHEDDAKSVIVKGKNVYYIKGDSIYKNNIFGNFVMITKNEFAYNTDNIYDVFINE